MEGQVPRVRDIGEFRLIDRIARIVGPPGRGALIGIGDDTALLEPREGRLLLATCDVQVEGVHFLREVISPRQLGRRALAINLSDIASMGGIPRWAILSLVLPPDSRSRGSRSSTPASGRKGSSSRYPLWEGTCRGLPAPSWWISPSLVRWSRSS